MPLDHRAINLIHRSYQEMKSCRRKYKLNKQIHGTKSEPRYKKKIKKNNHTALVFWISVRTDSARCNEKRRAL